jgi:hypothetical protein
LFFLCAVMVANFPSDDNKLSFKRHFYEVISIPTSIVAMDQI